jgi:hypothetical protein
MFIRVVPPTLIGEDAKVLVTVGVHSPPLERPGIADAVAEIPAPPAPAVDP